MDGCWTWLVGAALLVGCIGGEDAPEQVSAAGVEQGGGATASAAETTTPVARVVLPLAFEGSVPAFVESCVFTVAGSACEAVPVGAFENRFEVDASGNGLRLALKLEWTATSATTEQMAITFSSFTDAEFVRHVGGMGPSPVTLMLEAPFVLEPGWTHRIGVGVPVTGVGTDVGTVIVAAAAQEQPFTVTGELVLAPPNP